MVPNSDTRPRAAGRAQPTRTIFAATLAAGAALALGCSARVDEPTRTATVSDRPGCVRPEGVQNVTFSATKYPRIRAHVTEAIAAGAPVVLTLRRTGADRRRRRDLAPYPTRPGYDRDEYPPAVARASGTEPSVAYVPARENRSHGATLGAKLRRFCDGTRFRYVFY